MTGEFLQCNMTDITSTNLTYFAAGAAGAEEEEAILRDAALLFRTAIGLPLLQQQVAPQPSFSTIIASSEEEEEEEEEKVHPVLQNVYPVEGEGEYDGFPAYENGCDAGLTPNQPCPRVPVPPPPVAV